MKMLLSCYRFLLFFFVTWTVYNTTLFFYLVLPPDPGYDRTEYLFAYSNMYLLGALDFHQFISGCSQFLGILKSILKFDPILLYALLVNFTALYAWCRRQNPFTAYGLAVAAWFAGPYTPIIYGDVELWRNAFVATLAFYLLLLIANNYRRKHFPHLRLPPWLEWRHPDLMPPLEIIGERMSAIFKKRSKMPSPEDTQEDGG